MVLALTLATLMGPALADEAHPAAQARLRARVVAQEPTVPAGSEGKAGKEVREVSEIELSLLLLERPQREMPIVVRLQSDTAQLLDRSIGWDEVVDDKAQQPRMRARVVAGPGTHEVRAEVSYVVCGPKWCRQKTAQTAWRFEIE